MKQNFPRMLKMLLLTFCVVGTLSACSKSQTDYSGTTSVRMYRDSDTDIITLTIPKGYIDHFVLAGPPVPGAKEEDAEVLREMYFTAEAGTLKPRSAENNQAFVYPNSLTDEFSFNISIWNKRSKEERTGYLQNNYAARMQSFTFSCVTPQVPRPRFGLEWYAKDISNCPKQIHWGPEDMLIDRDITGGVNTLLFCASDEVQDWTPQSNSSSTFKYNPKCEHHYYFKGLNASVTLRYSRFYVQDWRLLEQRINALLLSFVQTTSSP